MKNKGKGVFGAAAPETPFLWYGQSADTERPDQQRVRFDRKAEIK